MKKVLFSLMLLTLSNPLFSQKNHEPDTLESLTLGDQKSYYRIEHRPAEFLYTRIPSDYIQDISWAIWYSNESINKVLDWDINGGYSKSSGWGTEFMSGNVRKKQGSSNLKNTIALSELKPNISEKLAKNNALYWGFGMGMGFYSRGKKSNVVLNTTRDDSGYTRLVSNSMHFWGKLHWERRFGSFYPFIAIAAGPRIFYTNQQVRTYLTLSDYDSPTAHNALTSVSLAYELTAGIKKRVANHVYFFASISALDGSDVTLANLHESKFNGLAYNLDIKQLRPTQTMVRLGVIFDLSHNNIQKKEVRAPYDDTIWYSSITKTVHDSINNVKVYTRYIYCPCCGQNNINTSQNQNQQYPSPFLMVSEKTRAYENSKSNSYRINYRNKTGAGNLPSSKKPAPKIAVPKINN
ncbi:MAG: hypothetical protein EXR17_06525 [Flavobacteriaceae bacterium]|nr:hypothetical protein [Flavobacteriaceae bacterium]